MVYRGRINFVRVLLFVVELNIILRQGHCYDLPAPHIETLTPRGVRISIPDEPGLQLYAFNGNINKVISVNHVGRISGETYRSQNGRWIIEDSRALLEENDVLHYWSYAQANGVRHTKEGQVTISSKSPSGGEQPNLPNRTETPDMNLLLDENFESLNESLWTRDIKMPLAPDYEFCVYHNQNHDQLLTVSDGMLRIKPLLLEDSYGENATVYGKIQLVGCTSNVPVECSRRALSFSILPPVISARITTKTSFSFRYGKIEIRAKFPEGDWLYPEMWLEPRYSLYGTQYASGRVLLGYARGNDNLVSASNVSDFCDSRKLEFGVRTGTTGNVRDKTVTSTVENGPKWTERFHVYTTIWTEDGFTFLVDGHQVGRLEPGPEGWIQGSNTDKKAAPFDQEFYITLGVGVGSVRVFPDRTISSGSPKPWKNLGSKAMQEFWRHKNEWLPSWRRDDGRKTALEVDYVRVWSA